MDNTQRSILPVVLLTVGATLLGSLAIQAAVVSSGIFTRGGFRAVKAGEESNDERKEIKSTILKALRKKEAARIKSKKSRSEGRASEDGTKAKKSIKEPEQLSVATTQGTHALSSRPGSPTRSPTKLNEITPGQARPVAPRQNVFRVVLTGGPCAGKSTALSAIQDRMSSLGYNVLLVPEMATQMINGGATPHVAGVFSFQKNLLKSQMALEDGFVEIARDSGKDSVVIFDRGTMDSAAFLPPDLWQEILDESDWSIVKLRDRRYDAIIHLTTSAIGAEDFYTTANNNARTETIDQARQQDYRLRDAWLGHSHFKVIDNSTDFAGKINRVLEYLSYLVGVPIPSQTVRRYLLRKMPEEHILPERCERFLIEQTSIVPDTDEQHSNSRIRRKGQNGMYTYTFTTTTRLPSTGEILKLERQITGREYNGWKSHADPTRKSSFRRQTCFLHENHYLILEEITDATHTRSFAAILEVEGAGVAGIPSDGASPDGATSESGSSSISVPSWLEIEREVTHDPNYSDDALVARKWDSSSGGSNNNNQQQQQQQRGSRSSSSSFMADNVGNRKVKHSSKVGNLEGLEIGGGEEEEEDDDDDEEEEGDDEKDDDEEENDDDDDIDRVASGKYAWDSKQKKKKKNVAAASALPRNKKSKRISNNGKSDRSDIQVLAGGDDGLQLGEAVRNALEQFKSTAGSLADGGSNSVGVKRTTTSLKRGDEDEMWEADDEKSAYSSRVLLHASNVSLYE